MVYCIQGAIAFGNATARDQARADLESFITNRPRWSADTIASAVNHEGFPALSFALRFTSEADASALEGRIRTFLSNQRVPRNGSRLWAHRCRHDEAEHPGCVVQREAVVVGGSWTVV